MQNKMIDKIDKLQKLVAHPEQGAIIRGANSIDKVDIGLLKAIHAISTDSFFTAFNTKTGEMVVDLGTKADPTKVDAAKVMNAGGELLVGIATIKPDSVIISLSKDNNPNNSEIVDEIDGFSIIGGNEKAEVTLAACHSINQLKAGLQLIKAEMGGHMHTRFFNADGKQLAELDGGNLNFNYNVLAQEALAGDLYIAVDYV